MGKLLEELRNFLSTATPEQLEQAWKGVEQFKDVKPTITEYIKNMKEIKEAYCSFKVAKLLKKKGFDIPTTYNYVDDEGTTLWHANDYTKHRNSDMLTAWSAPTHQMACAWIRSKGYSVEVHATAVGWHWEVCKVNGTSIAFGGNIPSEKTNDGGAYDDYDECMDNALIYTLTNLI